MIFPCCSNDPLQFSCFQIVSSVCEDLPGPWIVWIPLLNLYWIKCLKVWCHIINLLWKLIKWHFTHFESFESTHLDPVFLVDVFCKVRLLFLSLFWFCSCICRIVLVPFLRNIVCANLTTKSRRTFYILLEKLHNYNV